MPAEVRRLGVIAIDLYRLAISPLLPAACRYVPTCSQYGREAMLKHGLWRGTYLTARRLARCTPFHPGGVDPVP